MGTLFTDNFNRGDGAAGNGWTATVGSFVIDTNEAKTGADYSTWYRTVPTGAEADIITAMSLTANSTYASGYGPTFTLRADASLHNGYEFAWQAGGVGTAQLVITKIVSSTRTTLATVNGWACSSGAHTLEMSCVGTTISAKFDGTTVATVTDGDVGSGTYLWCYEFVGNHEHYDDWTISVPDVIPMYIQPVQVPTSAVGAMFTLTGVDTAWTPGTPGSPEFTCSAGSIIAQVITGANQATIYYDAPASEQTVTITDPDYGRTASLEVSDAAPPVPPGTWDPFGILGWLASFKTWVQDQFENFAGGIVPDLAMETNIGVLAFVKNLAGYTPLKALYYTLNAIWDHLANDHDDPTTLRSVVVDSLAGLNYISGNQTNNLGTVLTAIDGIAVGDDVTALTQAVAALQTTVDGLVDQVTAAQTSLNLMSGNDTKTLLGVQQAVQADLLSDYNALVTAIGNVRGTGAPTIADLQSQVTVAEGLAIAGIACTIAGVFLKGPLDIINVVNIVQDVVDHVGTVSDILDALWTWLSSRSQAPVQAPGTDLATIAGGISDLVTDLGTLSTNVGTDQQAVLDAIDGAVVDVNTHTDTALAGLDLTGSASPVWPGIASVTLGQPVALDAGTYVAGPMDGVLLNITAMDKLIPYFTLGTFHTYRNLGRFAFVTDNGYMEDWRGIGSQHGLLMPLKMTSAGGLYISCYTGVTGTATPFVVNG